MLIISTKIILKIKWNDWPKINKELFSLTEQMVLMYVEFL